MIWNNVLAWSLQIGALVAIAAGAARVLGLKASTARLLYWQLTLAACLALPLLRPWKRPAPGGDVSVSTVAMVQPASSPAGRSWSLPEAAVWILAAGVLARLLWLAAGFWRLRQYRRQSVPFGAREGVMLLLSEDLAGPVTFGLRRPVVLLPARFPDLEGSAREAILCHELLHVRRRDWPMTIAEELVRAAFWFHPAIWWVLGEIGLAREQEVDRQAVERTRAPEAYVDALLAIAGAKLDLNLAPAPLFLRKRHLQQRVFCILKEVRMSKTRLFSSLAGAFIVLAAAGWFVTATFPLAAAPQVVADAPGVSVDLGGAPLMHRSPVDYPETARQRGIQGTVIVQVKLGSTGTVTDAQVLYGPEELRRAVLQSVLDWHFDKDVAETFRQVSITFNAAAGAQAPRQTQGSNAAPAALPGNEAAVLQGIETEGLSDSARANLLARLPVHEGDVFTSGQAAGVFRAVTEFDEHLTARIVKAPSGGGLALIIRPGGAAPPVPPSHIRVGGNVQSTKLINQPKPAYPADAKEARIQGVVKLHASVGKDGTIENLTVISGHPLLAPAALEAVKQWVYEPTYLNGQPVAVDTEIDVRFTLSR
jgi:TonB family protein